MQVFRCYGSRSAATEKYSLKLFTCKLGQSVVKACETRVGARFFRLKYGQLKCDRRAISTRSFQKRKYAARQLTFSRTLLTSDSHAICVFLGKIT